jgi:hypothetical protein
MTTWRVTGALVRAAATAALVTPAALFLGRPDLLVLAAPFGLVCALGIAHAPRRPVTGRVRLADRWLHEGQSTRLRFQVDSARGLEQVTGTLSPPAFVAAQPASGVVAATPRAGRDLALELAVSPRRWGVRSAGSCMIAATSPWGGYRWGPQRLPEASFWRCRRPGPSPPARVRTRSGWSGRTGRAAAATGPSSSRSGRSSPATGCVA